MAVSLYTSRVILAVLGVSDYGIYNVIGGFVAMFSVISGSITVAISRFITIEVGNQNTEKIKEIFSTSIIIQIGISVIIVLLCEVIGIWFIYNKMNIPADRLNASFWVMQCSLATFVINLLSTPYNAVIIAHERMGAFAYISILEVGLKLGIVFLLYAIHFDKLIVYAILLTAVSLIIRVTYSAYCKKYFKNESTFSFVFNKKLLFEMQKFIGWAFLGNGIVVIKDYGINILLNLFFGTVMNAARGIAGQVNAAVVSFVTNFMMAINPQITKSYAEKDLDNMHSLIIRGQKFSFYILFILLMLFIPNINYILSLWLKEVPEHTASLVILILLFSLTETYSNPLLTGVLAQGEIKVYELALTTIYTINFIVCYILLKKSFSVEWVFIYNIIFKIFVCIVLLIHSYKKYLFPIKRFLINCLSPTILVFMICFVLTFVLRLYNAQNFKMFIIQSILNFLITLFVIVFVGLNKHERNNIILTIKSKIKRK